MDALLVLLPNQYYGEEHNFGLMFARLSESGQLWPMLQK